MLLAGTASAHRISSPVHLPTDLTSELWQMTEFPIFEKILLHTKCLAVTAHLPAGMA
jgi:hypothetical protein